MDPWCSGITRGSGPLDPTLRYSLDLYIVDNAEIAKECAAEDAMEDIDLNIEVIELTLEDMQGGRRQ